MGYYSMGTFDANEIVASASGTVKGANATVTAAIKNLQTILNQYASMAHFSPLSVDGVVGSATVQAVTKTSVITGTFWPAGLPQSPDASEIALNANEYASGIVRAGDAYKAAAQVAAGAGGGFLPVVASTFNAPAGQPGGLTASGIVNSFLNLFSSGSSAVASKTTKPAAPSPYVPAAPSAVVTGPPSQAGFPIVPALIGGAAIYYFFGKKGKGARRKKGRR